MTAVRHAPLAPHAFCSQVTLCVQLRCFSGRCKNAAVCPCALCLPFPWQISAVNATPATPPRKKSRIGSENEALGYLSCVVFFSTSKVLGNSLVGIRYGKISIG